MAMWFEQEENPAPDTYSDSAWRVVKHGAWVVWDGTVSSLHVCLRAPVCSLWLRAGMEFVGEVCADFLGLNDSQYQWIIDEHRRREQEVRYLCLWQLVAAPSLTVYVLCCAAAAEAPATEGAQGSERSTGG
jgi:hypothetical protein